VIVSGEGQAIIVVYSYASYCNTCDCSHPIPVVPGSTKTVPYFTRSQHQASRGKDLMVVVVLSVVVGELVTLIRS